MKIAILLLMLSFPLQTINWETNFETAKKNAKENHKLILLNFSGSDWCGPCIITRKQYLESPVFTAFSNDHLILVNADFPRKKANQLTAETVKLNEALADVYNKEGFFPLTLLLSADGKVIKIWKGKPEIDAEQWTAEIKTIFDANR